MADGSWARLWVIAELAVIWPIAGILILIGLGPVAFGFGMIYVGSAIERRLRRRS